MVSITVSFLTIGGALHHTLTGVVHTVVMKKGPAVDSAPHTAPRVRCSKLRLFSVLVSLAAFLLVFIVSMADPQGFVEILEKFASLTLNGQVGVFVFLMLLASRRHPSPIPLPLAPWLRPLVWTLPLFFNAAVVMDVYHTIRDILRPQTLLPVTLNGSSQLSGSVTGGEELLSSLASNSSGS